MDDHQVKDKQRSGGIFDRFENYTIEKSTNPGTKAKRDTKLIQKPAANLLRFFSLLFYLGDQVCHDLIVNLPAKFIQKTGKRRKFLQCVFSDHGGGKEGNPGGI
jgi:hypothetical protein